MVYERNEIRHTLWVQHYSFDYDQLLRSPAREIELPYIFTIKGRKTELFYFGESHSNDLSHPQFERLEKTWNDFSWRKKKSKTVIVEDGPHPPDASKEDAIRLGGGNGLVTYLAFQENVPVVCPEPPYKEQITLLEEIFPRNDIALYFFVRTAVSWQSTITSTPWKMYIQKFLSRYQEDFGWEEYDFSPDAMQRLYYQYFSEEFNPQDEDLSDLIFPSQQTVVNQVALSLNTLRDTAVVNCIKNLWNNGHNILAVYGGSHAVVQENILRNILFP